VPKNRFRSLRGEDDLQLYQFNKNIARHRFCRHCGIHAFGNPRAAPDQVLVKTPGQRHETISTSSASSTASNSSMDATGSSTSRINRKARQNLTAV
jgi:hypothetical protein